MQFLDFKTLKMCIITVTYSYYCYYCINTKEYLQFPNKEYSTTRTVSYRTREETGKRHRPHEWEYVHTCVCVCDIYLARDGRTEITR